MKSPMIAGPSAGPRLPSHANGFIPARLGAPAPAAAAAAAAKAARPAKPRARRKSRRVRP